MNPRLLLAAMAVGGAIGAAILAPASDPLAAPDDSAATTTPTTTTLPASFRPTITASIPAPPD